ncbi:MAG: hypothetical protein M1826_002941 [Phylliscum demangeonii]|nr:MAG: hypothetical protein M1826_002941 [Phylliscum demangeonii]
MGLPATRGPTTTLVRVQDMPCLVTGYREVVQRAHLVPRNEWKWFIGKGLRKYNHDVRVEGMTASDDGQNAVPLCAHIHIRFDDKAFGIVRKLGQWTTLYLTETRSLSRLHHNTTILLDPVVSPAFVLARLAWAVLPFNGVFFSDEDAERVVTLLDPTTKTWTAHRLLSQNVNHRLLEEGSRGSRSATSKKRDREPSSVTDSFGEEEGQPTERTQEWIADQRHERFLDTVWPIWSGERAGAAGLDLPSMDDRTERALAPIDQHRSKKALTAEEARILARMASV